MSASTWSKLKRILVGVDKFPSFLGAKNFEAKALCEASAVCVMPT